MRNKSVAPKWSTNEKNILKKNKNLSFKELAKLLPGRSVSAISFRRSQMGIIQSKRYFPKSGRRNSVLNAVKDNTALLLDFKITSDVPIPIGNRSNLWTNEANKALGTLKPPNGNKRESFPFPKQKRSSVQGLIAKFHKEKNGKAFTIDKDPSTQDANILRVWRIQ